MLKVLRSNLVPSVDIVVRIPLDQMSTADTRQSYEQNRLPNEISSTLLVPICELLGFTGPHKPKSDNHTI